MIREIKCQTKGDLEQEARVAYKLTVSESSGVHKARHIDNALMASKIGLENLPQDADMRSYYATSMVGYAVIEALDNIAENNGLVFEDALNKVRYGVQQTHLGREVEDRLFGKTQLRYLRRMYNSMLTEENDFQNRTYGEYVRTATISNSVGYCAAIGYAALGCDIPEDMDEEYSVIYMANRVARLALDIIPFSLRKDEKSGKPNAVLKYQSEENTSSLREAVTAVLRDAKMQAKAMDRALNDYDPIQRIYAGVAHKLLLTAKLTGWMTRR